MNVSIGTCDYVRDRIVLFLYIDAAKIPGSNLTISQLVMPKCNFSTMRLNINANDQDRSYKTRIDTNFLSISRARKMLCFMSSRGKVYGSFYITMP